VLTTWLARTNPTPSTRTLVEAGLWTLLAAAVFFCLALGIGALVGSRPAAISILLAWLLVVQMILRNITALGRFRDVLPSVALDRVAPVTIGDRHDQIHMASSTAVLVIVLWAVVPLAAGWWRTRTRDA
jgi:hypothetical protein